jgi:hypothetical protein
MVDVVHHSRNCGIKTLLFFGGCATNVPSERSDSSKDIDLLRQIGHITERNRSIVVKAWISSHIKLINSPFLTSELYVHPIKYT